MKTICVSLFLSYELLRKDDISLNFKERIGLTSTCSGLHSLLRPSELLSQSTDEIFSITIAASLREEGVTDLDPLLCSCYCVFWMLISDILNNCCKSYFVIIDMRLARIKYTLVCPWKLGMAI